MASSYWQIWQNDTSRGGRSTVSLTKSDLPRMWSTGLQSFQKGTPCPWPLHQIIWRAEEGTDSSSPSGKKGSKIYFQKLDDPALLYWSHVTLANCQKKGLICFLVYAVSSQLGATCVPMLLKGHDWSRLCLLTRTVIRGVTQSPSQSTWKLSSQLTGKINFLDWFGNSV